MKELNVAEGPTVLHSAVSASEITPQKLTTIEEPFKFRGLYGAFNQTCVPPRRPSSENTSPQDTHSVKQDQL